MEKIIAVIIAIAAAIAAFIFGRKTGSGNYDRQRDIRGTLDDIGETAEKMGNAGDRASRAADEAGDIANEISDSVSTAKSGKEDAQRADELIGELRRRAGEESQDS